MIKKRASELKEGTSVWLVLKKRVFLWLWLSGLVSDVGMGPHRTVVA
jgi:hypothetical protein